MLYALIVIYEKKIDESNTFNFMKSHLNVVNLIIFDNSTDLDILKYNKKYISKLNIKYYCFKKNLGLSKAYNFVIKSTKFQKNDYLIILDDDTHLNEDYISSVKDNLSGEYDILLPIVKTNKIIMSPSNIQFKARIKTIKNIDDIIIKKISAINSGMVVKMSVYNDILYNENLFLDYVDHDFMKNIHKYNKKIKILNSTIFQDYSREGGGFSKTRYKIYRQDFKKFCLNNNNIFYYYLSILNYELKKTFRR